MRVLSRTEAGTIRATTQLNRRIDDKQIEKGLEPHRARNYQIDIIVRVRYT